MKTKFLLFLSAILFVTKFTANSQTSWLITGNSNIATSNFIGTTNSQPLIMKTNNKERLRILPGGNIGIGTKTPDNTLHVFKGSAGTVTGWPYAPLVVENSAQCYINLLAPDNLETGVFFGKPESNISGGIIYNNTLSGPNSLQFRTGGNNIRMIIDLNGNVAVGTLSSNYRLKVSHTNAGLDIENNITSDNWEFFTSSVEPGPLELFFNSNLRGSFNATTGVYSALSDERLKTNIKPMICVLDKIKQLKPSTYQFKNTKDKQEYNGFIAQEVMQIFPSLVTHSVEPKRNLDVYTLDYSGFGVIAIKGIQELQETIQQQKQTIANQQQKITTLEGRISKLEEAISINKSSFNISSAYLKQNAPNPFSKNTIIQCYVPSSVIQAQLIIYDPEGKQLKSFALSNSGINEVTINAGTLSSGQYNYSLLVDGKKVDSKNMIITK